MNIKDKWFNLTQKQTPMTIAIFETEHFEMIYALVRLFDPEKNNIVVFTNMLCYQQLPHTFNERMNLCQWVITGTNETKYHFIYRIYKEVKLRRIELLMLNTVNNNFIFYALLVLLLQKVRIIAGIHDVNTFFSYKPALSIRRLVRHVGKRCLIRIVHEFNVISLTMAGHLKDKLPAHKKVHCLPGSIFEEAALKIDAAPLPGQLHLVVPGTIDGKRRNYNTVFDLLEQANRISLPVFMVLLGSPYQHYGKAIIERCKHYATSNNNLKFYTSGIIDQSEFNLELDKAHLVFIPCVIDTVIFDSIPEAYGISKCSGNLFDVVRHAKPFIIPAQLQVDPFLTNSCIKYNNVNDIIMQLSALHNSPDKYVQLQNKGLNASRNYTIEKVRARNPGIFAAG